MRKTTGGEVAQLRARVEALEDVCAEAYQFAGEVGAPARVLDVVEPYLRRRLAGRAGATPKRAESGGEPCQGPRWGAGSENGGMFPVDPL